MNVLTYILYILLAIAILLLMVLIHEFGHYVVGKALKFKITEFSVGFGKALFSHTNKSGEKISLRIFPLGGYCAFAGEDGTDENGKPIKDKDAFTNQKPWKRILVFLAGISFNFLTAIIFSFILLVSVGYDIYQLDSYQPYENKIIEYVVSEEYLQDPEAHSLKDGDVVFYIEDTKVDALYTMNFSDLLDAEKEKFSTWVSENTTETKKADIRDYHPVKFTVRRDGKMQDVELYYVELTYNVYKRDNQGNIMLDENGNPLLQYETDSEGSTKYDDEGNPIPLQMKGYTLGANVETLENGEKVVSTINYVIYRHTFLEALERCVPVAAGFAWSMLKGLWMMITNPAKIGKLAGGPIATISMIASITQQSMLNILLLIPFISANLAMFNLLPIPALDGAHVIFTLIEWIRGKPIKREVENMIHSIGLIALFVLVILIDILHFVLP